MGDLGLKVPSLQVSLADLDHPLLHKANDLLADGIDSLEPILSIDDAPMKKVKVPGVRAALYLDDGGQPWIVAAGVRRQDTPQQDFYRQLALEARRAKKDYNRHHRPPLRTDVYSVHLLPEDWDERRLEAETRVARAEAAAAEHEHKVPELIRSAVTHVGQEQTDVIAGAEVSAIVEMADLDGLEFAWVGLRVVGPVDPNFTAVLLAEVPGVSRDEWRIEPNGMPHRDVRSGEVVWSALIDISAV